LVSQGHQVVVVSRQVNPGHQTLEDSDSVTAVKAPLADTVAMVKALKGCEAVYNCVGISYERGEQSYERVHLDGTRNLLSAMRQAEIDRFLHVSFLKARPMVDSPYHSTKWQAEEMVRKSGTNYTIFKPGVLYGEGDQFLSHLKTTLKSFPFFGLVGFEETQIAPLSVEDLCQAMAGCLEKQDAFGKTYGLVGPEAFTLKEIVELTADSLDIIPTTVSLPIFLHRFAAILMEYLMKTPLLTTSQVTMLSEDLAEPAPPSDELPAELSPTTKFSPGCR